MIKLVCISIDLNYKRLCGMKESRKQYTSPEVIFTATLDVILTSDSGEWDDGPAIQSISSEGGYNL